MAVVSSSSYPTPAEIKKMTVAALKEHLNAYNLAVDGLKPVLAKRLETFVVTSGGGGGGRAAASAGDDDENENDGKAKKDIEKLKDEAKKKAEDAIAKFEKKAGKAEEEGEEGEEEKPRKRVITDEDHLPTPNYGADDENATAEKNSKKRGRGDASRRKVRTIDSGDDDEEENDDGAAEEDGRREKRRRRGGKSKGSRGGRSKNKNGDEDGDDDEEEEEEAVEYESIKSIPCVANEGRIIGKGGTKIRELQAKYEVVMHMNRENGCVEIMGDRANVLECEAEVVRIIEDGNVRNMEREKQLQQQGRQRGGGGGGRGGRGDEKRGGGGGAGGSYRREEIPCSGMEGRIIGKGGENIRRLEADSGARVRINRERLVVEISGEPGCVETAVRLVQELMASSGADRGGGQQGSQQQNVYGGGQAFGQQQQVYGQPAGVTTQVYGAAASTYGQPATSSHATAPVYGQQQYSYGTQQVYGQSASAAPTSSAPVYGQQVYGHHAQLQQVAPPPAARPAIASLPPDWEEVNQDGQIYYWNTRTNLTQYERPTF
jgi:far upstream element-binding protein